MNTERRIDFVHDAVQTLDLAFLLEKEDVTEVAGRGWMWALAAAIPRVAIRRAGGILRI